LGFVAEEHVDVDNNPAPLGFFYARAFEGFDSRGATCTVMPTGLTQVQYNNECARHFAQRNRDNDVLSFSEYKADTFQVTLSGNECVFVSTTEVFSAYGGLYASFGPCRTALCLVDQYKTAPDLGTYCEDCQRFMESSSGSPSIGSCNCKYGYRPTSLYDLCELDCPTGLVQDSAGTICVCLANQYALNSGGQQHSGCTTCPIGAFSNPGSTTKTACLCPSGFILSVDETVCECPSNYYRVDNTDPNLQSCAKCPYQMISDQGKIRVQFCTCTSGYEQLSPTSDCATCRVGTYFVPKSTFATVSTLPTLVQNSFFFSNEIWGFARVRDTNSFVVIYREAGFYGIVLMDMDTQTTRWLYNAVGVGLNGYNCGNPAIV